MIYYFLLKMKYFICLVASLNMIILISSNQVTQIKIISKCNSSCQYNCCYYNNQTIFNQCGSEIDCLNYHSSLNDSFKKEIFFIYIGILIAISTLLFGIFTYITYKTRNNLVLGIKNGIYIVIISLSIGLIIPLIGIVILKLFCNFNLQSTIGADFDKLNEKYVQSVEVIEDTSRKQSEVKQEVIKTSDRKVVIIN